MRHKTAGRRLGNTTDYRKALYRNLVTDLLGYEKITTTEPKAKQVRILAEKMITLGKTGGLHSRRQAIAFIFDETVTEKVFGELATRYADRKGGYTRATKLRRRLGDGAAMVQLELVK
ncbi:MAG: 50S ribosomal protein L17 [Chloroflexota bacterium]